MKFDLVLTLITLGGGCGHIFKLLAMGSRTGPTTHL